MNPYAHVLPVLRQEASNAIDERPERDVSTYVAQEHTALVFTGTLGGLRRARVRSGQAPAWPRHFAWWS